MLKKLVNLSKKQKVLGVSCIAFVLLIIVFALTGNKSSDFYDIMNGVFSNELGSYKFTFDVNTSNMSESSVETPSVTEEAVEGDITGTPKNEFKEWGNSEGIESFDWEYPNYKVTIEGCTTSVEPLVTNFTVTLATKYFNDKFTDVTVLDGNYYINIEQMRYWLVSSGDNYLVSLGKELPQGSKYLTIPENEFVLSSRYAEDGELDLSKYNGLETLYRRFIVVEKALINEIENNLGDAGLSTSKDSSVLNLTGDDSLKVLNVIKKMVTNRGSYYDSIIDKGYKNGLYTEDQLSQAKREKDNVTDALYDLYMALDTKDLSSLGLNIRGTSRKYNDSNKNTVLEASVSCDFKVDDTSYDIAITMYRSGNRNDVVLPDGSQVTRNKLKSDSLVEDTLNKVFDYFNITNIKLSNKLEITPDKITSDILDSFIELANDVGTFGVHVTRNNVYDLISKYANYNVSDNSSNDDIVNSKLVSDFLESINNVTGGVVKTVEVEKEEELIQYPELNTNLGGIKVIGGIDTDNLNPQLAVIDLLLMNETDMEQTIDLTNFTMRTLLSSMYPSNNLTLLRNYDNTWNENKISNSITLAPNNFGRVKLYFVISEDKGYMDLWYGDDNLGEVIAY